mgnify:CR=1 FL=1
MKIISHRGNLKGPEPYTENTPEKIDYVLSLGYDVEIDVWYKDNDFYLGHDTPVTLVPSSFLLNRSDFLWVHCKNIACVNKLRFWDLNYFYHEHDMVTLTSKRYIWSYPGVQEFYSNQICLDFSPQVNYDFYKSKFIAGLCVDYIERIV